MGRNKRASSHFFTKDQAFSYDLTVINQFVKKQCVSYSADGDLEYDFKKAEDWVVDRFFTGRPILDLDMPRFMFPEESLGTERDNLKGLIAQEPLPGQTRQEIESELSTPTLASRTLQAMSTVVSFITASAQELSKTAGDTLVEDYVHNTLLIPGDMLQSKEVSKQVCLKHLDSVCELLDQLANPDPFAGVDLWYRQELSKEDVPRLEAAALAMGQEHVKE